MGERYISRGYLKEKWEKLKWDMEKSLDIYGEHSVTDKISVDEADRVKYNIETTMESILKELYNK